MPALSSSSNLRYRPTKPAPGPVGVLAPPSPSRGGFGGALPQHPFHAALQETRQRVERAQVAQPKQPTPYIPRVPNPTRAQAQAALTIAHHSQQQALGPNPGTARIKAYQQELAADPRQHEYLATLMHYARALAQPPVNAPLGLAKATQQAAPKDVQLPLLGLAHISVPFSGALARGASHALASVAPGLTAAGPEAGFMRNLGSDLLSVGEFPVVAGYKLAESGVQALGGNTKPATDLASGLLSGVEHGAVGELAQGNGAAALKAFKEHPLISGLEVAGPAAVAGRATGAAVRAAGSTADAGGLRGALARAGSTVRPPIALTEDAAAAKRGLVRQRSYSKDSGRKAVQVAVDRSRQPVLDAQGNPVTIQERGRTVPVLKPTVKQQESFQKRRANFEASRTQGAEFVARENARKAVNKAESPGRSPLPAIRGRVGQELAQLVASGTIRSVKTFEADLNKRAAAIEAAIKEPGSFRTRDELKAATGNARMLRKAASDPKLLARAPQIVATGLRYADVLNKGDAPLAALDLHPEAQLSRSALSEYALAHMDAQHFTVAQHKAAEAAATTPAEKLAVSGRDPALMQRHEAAKGEALQARRAVATVQTQLRQVQRQRDLLVRQHASYRASQGRRAATAAERQAMDLANAHLKAVEHGVRAAKAEAVQARDAIPRKPPIRAALRHSDGRILTNEQIRAHAKAAGRNPDTLAYVPHVTGTGSKSAFHKPFRPISRPSGTSQARTGHLYQRGATAIGRDVVREEVTNKATATNQVQAFDRFIQESGVRHPQYDALKAKLDSGGKLTRGQARVVASKGHFNAKEGLELAKRLEADTNSQYIPVRAFGAGLSADARRAVSDAQSPIAMETAHHGLLNDRVVQEGDTNPAHNVVLVPKHQLDQLLAHLKPAGEVEKAVQLLNSPFRRAVLPQPRWLTGNALEPYVIRLPLSGAGVNVPGMAIDIIAGRKVLKALDKGTPEMQRAAHEIRASQIGGLFIGKRGASVRRTYEDFTGKTQSALYGAHVMRNLPVVKQLGDMAIGLTNGFFHVNRVIEASTQYQAFGKAVRGDIQNFTGSYLKTVTLGKQAVDEAAKGLVGTPTQHRYMELQHELLGQYDSFNPTMRRLVQSAAPFLPWTMASLRFVYWTVPAHHTAAFSAFMKLGSTVIGQWEEEHEFLSPAAKEGTLADALVRPDKGLVDLTRYGPYGVSAPLAHGDLGGIPSTVLPQLSGALNALGGQDPFGQGLQVPKTGTNEGKASGPQRGEAALSQLIEATVPLVSQGTRLMQGGGTPYATSNFISELLHKLKGEQPEVKPESKHMSAVNRTLNPFRPTYLKNPGGGASSDGWNHPGEAASATPEEKWNR